MENLETTKWQNIINERLELIDIFKEFDAAVKNNAENFVYVKILTRLSDFAILHFANTENFLKERQVSDADLITYVYKDFIYKITRFKIELLMGKKLDVNDINDFLSKWADYHLLDSSSNYIVEHQAV